jgi:hypothetical protein
MGLEGVQSPQVLLAKTNPQMARFMMRRWGFRPRSETVAQWIKSEYQQNPDSGNWSAHLFLPLPQALAGVTEMVDYLGELEQRLGDYRD